MRRDRNLKKMKTGIILILASEVTLITGPYTAHPCLVVIYAMVIIIIFLTAYFLFLYIFYFTCIGVLSACMSV